MSGTETRLLLIRHGRRQHSEGRYYQHACPGLDDIGIAQAKALAARLARDPTLTVVVVLASKARRSFQTAEIVAETLGVSVIERTCDLCENHPGAAEGLTQSEMAEQFGPSYASVPRAEAQSAFIPRACASLERIVTTYGGRQILAVTHSGVIKASFVALGKMPMPQAMQVWSANTGITEWSLTRVDDAGNDVVWRLARHNDTAHLDCAGRWLG